jgi:hypothetical protein
MNVLSKSVFLICFWLLPCLVNAQTYTETHYVTQSGAGSKTGRSLANAWALSNFHNSNNWNTNKALDGKIGPGDVVYFSGNFTERVMVTRGGSSSGSITLDGYAAGDCNPLNAVCTNSALLQQGMQVGDSRNDPDYIVIQDFRMTDPNGKRPTLFFSGTYGSIDHCIVRRNYVYFAGDKLMTWVIGKNNIIVDNKFFVYGQQKDTSFNTEAGISLVELDNSIFARNEVGHIQTLYPTASTSTELICTHGCQNLLIEYNNCYGAPGQGGIRPKEWRHRESRDIIIRFNKVHGNLHSTQGKGIYPRTNYNGGPKDRIVNIYIYGNYVYNNGTHGIMAGTGIEGGLYVWANIISDNKYTGFCLWQPTVGPLHLYNNTIVRNNTSGGTELGRGGIVITASEAVKAGSFIKNNLLWNNRPAGERSHMQIYTRPPINSLEHNSYYHSLSAPTVYYDGGHRKLEIIQSNYGLEKLSPAGIIENPLFIDPDGSDNKYGTVHDNYRLADNSPAINKGGAITGRFSVNLSGGDSWFKSQTGYSTLTFGFDDALDPVRTDWTTNPPTVVTAKQTDYGKGWDRGAYVYRPTTSTTSTTSTEPPLASPEITDIEEVQNY